MHVPEGATPKDGPSAGVAMATSIVSILTGIPVRRDVAMTGEITLRGRVLPIGGLKEKLLAALRAGITTVFIPKENEKDLAEIPDNVKKHLKLIPVADVDEVIAQALARRPEAIEWEEPPEPVAPPPPEPADRFAAALTGITKGPSACPAGLSAVIDASGNCAISVAPPGRRPRRRRSASPDREGIESVNKMDLIAAVADQTDLPRTKASEVVDAVFGAIEGALKNKEEVRLVGFGTFATAERKAGTGRNPRTGEEMTIPASTTVRFKAGKGLKDAVRRSDAGRLAQR